MKNEPFKPQLRLIVQASIPVMGEQQGDILYNEIKIFLLAWHKDITLNGQTVKMLEPCCKERKEKKDQKPPIPAQKQDDKK